MNGGVHECMYENCIGTPPTTTRQAAETISPKPFFASQGCNAIREAGHSIGYIEFESKDF